MAAVPADKILELRELIARKEGKLSRERLPSSTLSCGIPKAGITEIAGNFQVEWVISFFRENPALKVFWIERGFSLLPTALYQRGVNPDRFIFAEGGDELFPCIRKALRCQVFECVVAPSVFTEERVLKALQLLSEKADSSLLLLARELKSSWPISLQFEVNRGATPKSFEIMLKKNK
ncbi:MAG: hypothetical protein P4M08_14865 [Oligoflexia bacterium]|nr:hypothetical protein [Oligoflexia bacterium]